MTTVNVTKTENTITVTDNNVTTTVKVPETSVVTATTVGPQGPTADNEVNVDNAVNKSIVYYDGSSSSLKANSTWTTDTLTNWGNF